MPDVKAVVSPITAIFDLSEEVHKMSPKILKMVTYTTIFVVFWLFWDFILMIIFITKTPLFDVILFVLFIVGLIALKLLFITKNFINYYIERHKVVKTIRDETPVVHIPSGSIPLERLIVYLQTKNINVKETIRKGTVKSGAKFKKKSGEEYLFNYVATLKPSIFWRLFGSGNSGFSLYIKYFERTPDLKDIIDFECAVRDVSELLRIPPKRVIALYTLDKDKPLGDEVYEYVTKNTISFKHRFGVYYCTLQLITECDDGTYDFIPFVVEI